MRGTRVRTKKIASGFDGASIKLNAFPIENLWISPVILEETKDDPCAPDRIRLVLFAIDDNADAVGLWTFSQLSSSDPAHVFKAASVFASEIDMLLHLKTEGAIGALFSRLIKSGRNLASSRIDMPSASRYRFLTHYGEKEIVMD